MSVRLCCRMLKILYKLLRRLISVLRSLLGSFKYDIVKCRIYPAVIYDRRHHGILHMSHYHIAGILSLIRKSACYHLIHGNAERIQIRSCIGLTALSLLRSHIMSRAYNRLTAAVRAHPLGNAEITDLDTAFLGNDYILALDISVNDAVSVCLTQSLGSLHGYAYGLLV